MLDELLGRAELKERIAELEEEKEHLERRAAAEEERRAEAVRERQDAEERVNRLEDRVTELEDRVERQGSEAEDIDYRGTERLRGERADAVLDRLVSLDGGPEGVLTAMVDEEVPDTVRDAFDGRAALVDRAAPCLAVTDDAGLLSAALSPPVAPDPFAEWGDRVRLDRSWFRPTGRFAFALVRADLFAYGEYDGTERLEVKGFESAVKGSHSKGGFSQARFERRRDEQIEAHLDRCREALAEREADRLYVVGGREAVDALADVADATATVDATGDPRPALDDAFREFWTTTLYRV